MAALTRTSSGGHSAPTFSVEHLILIIDDQCNDDNNIMRIVTSRFFASKKMVCFYAANREEALEKFKERNIAIALMDYDLGSATYDGESLTKEIRGLGYKDLKIFSFSNNDNETLALLERRKLAGMDAVLGKPFNGQKFLALCKENNLV